MAAVLDAAGIGFDDLAALVATGYGREQVDRRSAAVTEITCHARGALHVLPETRLLLDVGGQDTKAIAIGRRGRVLDFAMNDKCAAGTGRFFEVMARALEIDLDNFGRLALSSTKRLSLNNVCTVFAESEAVGMVARGELAADIAAAICRAVAERVVALAKRVRPTGEATELAQPITLSGGVARNIGFVRALEEVLGAPVAVPPDPQIIGALGAALVGAERVARRAGQAVLSRGAGAHG
jgi:predicted CoA-substrate-specific enzyme activase